MVARSIATYLNKEHKVTIMLPRLDKEYEYEGIRVIPRMGSAFRTYDAVFCSLDTTREAILLSGSTPLFFLQHNTFAYPSIDEHSHVNIIANSFHGSKQFPNNDTFILPPCVNIEDYEVEPGDCITLINCNENKGGKIFHEIAKRMPDRKFLQVIGSYGTQFISTDEKPTILNIDNKPLLSGLGYLPNVTVMENQQDIREAYKRTRILLMPSSYESWGRTASEAICSGIPVIASPTVGLKENIGIHGIFVQRDNIEDWMKEINKLDGKKEYQAASKKAKDRAKEMQHMSKLEQLNRWLKKKIYGLQSNN